MTAVDGALRDDSPTDGNPGNVLSVIALSRRFGGILAVDQVSFELAAGEILGLMGANGAGKTTLFSMIAGNQLPSSGRIVFDGREIQGLRADRVNALGIARTFQIVRPFVTMTVLENTMVGALYGRARVHSRAEAEIKCRAILAETGLLDRADLPAGSLTLAGRKRLEIARALATEPRVLLLDEVLAGLNATEVSEALALIGEIRQRHGLSIIIIEHVMKALMRLSDRIVVLHDGRKIAEGIPREVAADPKVIAAYLGEPRHVLRAA
jgi:branched-chain amino acid transport system ATP-binding protein